MLVTTTQEEGGGWGKCKQRSPVSLFQFNTCLFIHVRDVSAILLAAGDAAVTRDTYCPHGDQI